MLSTFGGAVSVEVGTAGGAEEIGAGRAEEEIGAAEEEVGIAEEAEEVVEDMVGFIPS